jgi:hypothetical protein
MSGQAFRIVYIAGMTHSGSTLLDLLISGHSQVVSVGEAMRFSRGNRAPMTCTCDAESVWECPFWLQVDARIRDESGLSLRKIDLCDGEDGRLRDHNLLFYRAVQAVSGQSLIVDSSKKDRRLQRLLGLGLPLLPIHLVRQPHGVVYSHVKKGRSWLRSSLSYSKKTRRTRSILSGHPHSVMRYEELAARPSEILAGLMAELDLPFEEGQLDWAGKDRHNCGGNRMRRSRSSTIRTDDAWVEGLPGWQKLAVGLLTRRARL